MNLASKIERFQWVMGSMDDVIGYQFEQNADMQIQEMEVKECFGYIVQLVNMFKHTVIMSELQNEIGINGDEFFNYQFEKIVLRKGLTIDQWNRLLHITLATCDGIEITKISKKHLEKVHAMVSRLLDDDQQIIIFALINAIEKYMPRKYFTEK